MANSSSVTHQCPLVIIAVAGHSELRVGLHNIQLETSEAGRLVLPLPFRDLEEIVDVPGDLALGLQLLADVPAQFRAAAFRFPLLLAGALPVDVPDDLHHDGDDLGHHHRQAPLEQVLELRQHNRVLGLHDLSDCHAGLSQLQKGPLVLVRLQVVGGAPQGRYSGESPLPPGQQLKPFELHLVPSDQAHQLVGLEEAHQRAWPEAAGDSPKFVIGEAALLGRAEAGIRPEQVANKPLPSGLAEPVDAVNLLDEADRGRDAPRDAEELFHGEGGEGQELQTVHDQLEDLGAELAQTLLPEVEGPHHRLGFVRPPQVVHVVAVVDLEGVDEEQRLDREEAPVNQVAQEEVADGEGRPGEVQDPEQVEEVPVDVAEDDDRGGHLHEVGLLPEDHGGVEDEPLYLRPGDVAALLELPAQDAQTGLLGPLLVETAPALPLFPLPAHMNDVLVHYAILSSCRAPCSGARTWTWAAPSSAAWGSASPGSAALSAPARLLSNLSCAPTSHSPASACPVCSPTASPAVSPSPPPPGLSPSAAARSSARLPVCGRCPTTVQRHPAQ